MTGMVRELPDVPTERRRKYCVKDIMCVDMYRKEVNNEMRAEKMNGRRKYTAPTQTRGGE